MEYRDYDREPLTIRDYSLEPYSILCFGDSNTWGCIPMWEERDQVSSRYPIGVRWTSILQKRLGLRARVAEEGLGGRTTLTALPKDPKGIKVALPVFCGCLLTHRPLDMVILMTGTNDMHTPIRPTLERLGDGPRALIRIIDDNPSTWRDRKRPAILLIAPPCLEKAKGRTEMWRAFGEEGLELSHHFGQVYGQVARELDVDFLDAAAVTGPSEADGIHLSTKGHALLGQAVYEKVRSIMVHRGINL